MAFVLLEIISLFVRLIMASRLTGMKIKEYVKDVIIPTLIIVIIPTIIALIPHFIIKQSVIRLFFVCGTYAILYIILTYRFALDKSQKTLVVSKINNYLKSRK